MYIYIYIYMCINTVNHVNRFVKNVEQSLWSAIPTG